MNSRCSGAILAFRSRFRVRRERWEKKCENSGQRERCISPSDLQAYVSKWFGRQHGEQDGVSNVKPIGDVGGNRAGNHDRANNFSVHGHHARTWNAVADEPQPLAGVEGSRSAEVPGMAGAAGRRFRGDIPGTAKTDDVGHGFTG